MTELITQCEACVSLAQQLERVELALTERLYSSNEERIKLRKLKREIQHNMRKAKCGEVRRNLRKRDNRVGPVEDDEPISQRIRLERKVVVVNLARVEKPGATRRQRAEKRRRIDRKIAEGRSFKFGFVRFDWSVMAKTVDQNAEAPSNAPQISNEADNVAPQAHPQLVARFNRAALVVMAGGTDDEFDPNSIYQEIGYH